MWPSGVRISRPNSCDHGSVGIAAGRENLVADLIGLDEETSQSHELLRHKTLAAGQASGQPDFQHEAPPAWRLRSAEATVFAINMAMVSGPTPPGTGV